MASICSTLLTFQQTVYGVEIFEKVLCNVASHSNCICYYKLERICNAIASQFVIHYYKLARIGNAFTSQFVINYYKLARICNASGICLLICNNLLQIGTQRYDKLGRNSATWTQWYTYQGMIQLMTLRTFSADYFRV